MDEKFWAFVNELVEASEIEIDRPRGSQHPHHPLVVYPLDYGYLKNTRSGDQAGIDVWIGRHAEREVTAVVCTIDLDKSDAEIKILIGCTDKDIVEIMNFHNQGAQSALLIQRNSPKHTE
jgi:inorganic pyrophosphatase